MPRTNKVASVKHHAAPSDALVAKLQSQNGVLARTIEHAVPASLLDAGFIRLAAILILFPVGASTWWAGCRSGIYPLPCKIGPKTTVWRISDIRALLERTAQR